MNSYTGTYSVHGAGPNIFRPLGNVPVLPVLQHMVSL